MTQEEFIQLETQKANAFNLISVLFCQPEDEILDNEELFNSLKDIFLEISPESHIEVLKMQKAKLKVKSQDLLVEYARLFIGPFKTLAPPYSSVYLGEKTLMNDVTIWVMNFYQKSGVEFDIEIKDLPDHIAVETEFLYYLTFNMLKCIENGELDKAKKYWQNQKTFLKRHYQEWVPKLCDSIIENSKNEFYKSMAASVNSFVKNIPLFEFPA